MNWKCPECNHNQLEHVGRDEYKSLKCVVCHVFYGKKTIQALTLRSPSAMATAYKDVVGFNSSSKLCTCPTHLLWLGCKCGGK